MSLFRKSRVFSGRRHVGGGKELHMLLIFIVLTLFVFLQIYILTRPGTSETPLDVTSSTIILLNSDKNSERLVPSLVPAGGVDITQRTDHVEETKQSTTLFHNSTLPTVISSNNSKDSWKVPSAIINLHNNTLPASLWKRYTGNGDSWTPGFCQDFLGKTYDITTEVCPNRITCHSSQYSKKMGTCTLKGGIAVRPRQLHDVMTILKPEKILKSESMWLLPNEHPKCINPSFREAEKYIENFDPILPMIKMATLSSRTNDYCQRWVNGTTFFYVGMAKHIYFRFNVWYNLFRSLREHETEREHINIIRLPEIEGVFLFPELEKRLFGNVIPIENFHEQIVCFESLVLVSWAYGSPLFRCKMDGVKMKRKCLQCSGNMNANTDLVSFRQHILSGCSLVDRKKPLTKPHTITVIERKRYERFKGDPQKKFKRIWTNSKELIAKLTATFPEMNVTGVYAETLPICDQIRLAHETDILIAMHGAGLVHLWWQQENSKIIELVPKSQRGNAAFIILAKYLGRTHKLINNVIEKGAIVTVDVNKVIQEVKKLL